MTYRSRKWLDLSHEAPCCLNLAPVGCGAYPSVPCHSDALEDGRGTGHKSNDCLVVPGCPACHELFTRKHLGRDGYFEVHAKALKKYLVWAFENRKVLIA
jgi:hypothetical protein